MPGFFFQLSKINNTFRKKIKKKSKTFEKALDKKYKNKIYSYSRSTDNFDKKSVEMFFESNK